MMNPVYHGKKEKGILQGTIKRTNAYKNMSLMTFAKSGIFPIIKKTVRNRKTKYREWKS